MTVKNYTQNELSAILKVTGLTTATKYRQSIKIEQKHGLNLLAGEAQIIKGQISIPIARAVIFTIFGEQ